MKNVLKRVIASMLMAAMVLSITACSATTKNKSSVNVESISDDSVLMSENLEPVTLEEGEEAGNPYYKRGTSEDGTACYTVHIAGQDEDLDVPMDNTVIYYMDEGEPYIEQVSFSFTDGDTGETIEQEQYRIYVLNAVSDNDNAAAGADDSAETQE